MKIAVTKYRDSFHNKKYQGSTEIISTTATPIKYKGFLIYHRLVSKVPGGNIFDIVKDGVCVGMCAGLNGAKNKIDSLK